MDEQIRIIVADDHTLFREGVRALLSSIPELDIIAEAATGDEAVQLAKKWVPDVILMDIQMPGMNGLDATRSILEDNSNIGVIVVTMFDDDDSVFAAMRAGARGYILKGADQEDMVRAIEAVARGEALFGPSIASRIMDYFNQPLSKVSTAFPELTPREREILELLAQGMNNHGIATRLTLSLKTVRNHVSNILNKLQVSDRVQAVLRAREAGMGKRKGK